jgi:translation initiation factor IF-2
MSKHTPKIEERSPVVVIMGHIDHGKSTLLDYIRKSNVVAGEAGGITQHLSAYEVAHKTAAGATKKITFLDTPGHESFSSMRERGAKTADIAILIVSAEDSVKAQTREALKTILDAKIPYVVAINKIDRPNANPEKVKLDLAEAGVYVEGYGGNIPFALISATTGMGISDLLETIVLVAELEQFTGDRNALATGMVIESRLDPKRGITATLVVKNGTLTRGQFVVVGSAYASTRMMEDSYGKAVESISFSSPLSIIGFDVQPEVGSGFDTYATKKEAEAAVADYKHLLRDGVPAERVVYSKEIKVVPIIIKADVAGTLDAVEKEIKKLEIDTLKFKIIARGIGAISENELRSASADKEAFIVGFHVALDSRAKGLNETLGVPVATFDVIYKLSDYVAEQVELRRPRTETAEARGSIKILKVFSETKDKQVIGGVLVEGVVSAGASVKILRREAEIGTGKIIGMQQGKMKVREITDGEGGLLVESKVTIAPGDVLQAFVMVTL